MRKLQIMSLAICAAAVCIGCSKVEVPDSPVYSETRTVKLNVNNEQQTMDGFGASDGWRCQMIGEYWPDAKKKQIADWLFSTDTDENGNPKGIGLSVWRFNIGTGSAEQGPMSGIKDEWRRSECFQNANGTYDWTKQAGARWFLKAAKERGVDQFLMFTLSAPVHMTQNGVAYATAKQQHMNIKTGKLADYADFLVESIDNLQKKDGITFNYLSPVNEPQWDWMSDTGAASQEGTPATNQEMSDFTKLLSQKLSAKSLTTQVVLGEAATISFLSGPQSQAERNLRDDQVNELWSASSPMCVDQLPNVARIVSGHSYWTVWPVNSLVSERQTLNARIKQIPGLKYWQTEYSILESPGESEIPNGNGNKRDLGMKTALFVARIIHNDLVVANATSWQWWTALTRADYKDGLIYLDDGNSNGSMASSEYCQRDGYARDSKLMWAFGNYSYFIRPGMVRINMDGSDHLSATKDIMVSAYKDAVNKRLVVVAVNVSASDRRYRLDAGDAMATDELIPYVTSDKYNLTKGEAVRCTGFVIPAKSVVTYVGQLK